MLLGNKMKVKVYKEMVYLPKVFMTSDLVKHALTERVTNCAEYTSRSGMSMEGCLMLSPYTQEKIRVIHGIYYTPVEQLLTISFRHKHFYNAEGIMNFIKSLNIDYLQNPPHEFLIKYDNYGVMIYDKFKKGRLYEFPIVTQQGHLTIYEVPPAVDEIQEHLFDMVNKISVYNHVITSIDPFMVYKNLYTKGGDGVLIYTPKKIVLKVESPDHGTKEIETTENTWILFSHPKPKGHFSD